MMNSMNKLLAMSILHGALKLAKCKQRGTFIKTPTQDIKVLYQA